MPAAVFEAVLGNLAVAGAVAALAAAAGRWLRPAVAHALWLLVLVKLVTPPVVTVPLRILPAVSEPAPPPRVAAVPVPMFVPAAAVVPLPVETPRVPPAPAAWSPSWESVLAGAWVAGAVAYLLVAAGRVRRFGKLLSFGVPAPALAAEVAELAARMGLRRAPRVRLVPGGIAPLVWAVGRPTLFFPAALLPRLSPEQRHTLLAHELAHLRRWDHLVRAVEFVAVAVYWWCPLAWVARRELRRLEEEACDAEVTAAAPDARYAYASAIVETIDYVAGVPVSPVFASAIGDARSLRRRLVSILEGKHAARTTPRARVALLVVSVVILAAGPKLERLTAATRTPPPIGNVTVFKGRAILPRPSQELAAEFASFSHTPTPLFGPAELGQVTGAARSPDGKRLAVAGGSTVRVFDLAARCLVLTVDHAGTVNAVAFSPDGSRFATAGSDGTATIWDVDGAKVQTLRGHAAWVTAIAFSPDGRTLATGSYDRSVILWDTHTGTSVGTLAGHDGGVRAVAFSPDGSTVASGGADHTVRVWSVGRRALVHTRRVHKAAVRAVAFSSDGSTVASADENHAALCWRLGSDLGTPVTLPDEGVTVAFAGEAVVVIGTAGGHLVRLNPTTGRVAAYIGVAPGHDPDTPAHPAGVVAVLPSTDGRTIVTVSADGTTFGWTAGEPDDAARQYRGGHRATAVGLSPDGGTLATGGHDGVVRVWDAASGSELVTIPAHTGAVTTAAFGAGGRLVTAGTDERVCVWDARSGAALRTLVQSTAELHVSVSPDGSTVAIGGRGMPGVSLVSLTSPGKPRRVGGALGTVSAVAFSPSGDRLATGYLSGVVRVWDVVTARELVRTSPRSGCVDGLAFAPDGATVAVTLNADADIESESGPVHETILVDARTGAIRAGTLSHPAPVTAAAVASDGRILTAAHDGNVYVWDGGRPVRVFRGHADAVRGVALAADGSTVYSAGDRAVKRWVLK